MANKIQFMRGLKNNLPSSADVGMPLWCTDTKELYIGTGTGVSKVGGSESSSSEPSQSQTVVVNSEVPVVTDPISVFQDDPDYQTYYDNYRYGNELMLKDNTAYNFHIDDYISFQLPEIDDGNVFHQILIQLYVRYSDCSINFGTSYFFNSKAPEISETGYYNIIYEYDSKIGQWVCGVIKKGYDSNVTGGSSN